MSLELKKKEMELKRVVMAKEEMQLRIEERLDEIERVNVQIKIQDEAIMKITKELDVLKNKKEESK